MSPPSRLRSTARTTRPRRSNSMSKRLLAIAAAGAAAMLTLSSCGGSGSGGGTPNAAPTDKVLHLSFLQDPGQPPDPDVYYAGQGLLLTTNLYDALLQYKGRNDKRDVETRGDT